jgi:hypothetical protein
MRYKVNVTLVSEIDLYIDADNRTEAASKAYRLAQSRDRIIERGDFRAIVSASDAEEIV